MLRNKLVSQKACSIFSVIASFIFMGVGHSQTFEIAHKGKTGHAFKTHEGTVTALHVGGLAFDYIFPAMDIGIETKSRTDKGFRLSDKPPAYFIDRRGTRYSLNATGTYGLQTVVDMRFYPGESGMPVFAGDGSVCCIVLGNAFTGGRWRGRVARVTPLVDSINKPTVEAQSAVR